MALNLIRLITFVAYVLIFLGSVRTFRRECGWGKVIIFPVLFLSLQGFVYYAVLAYATLNFCNPWPEWVRILFNSWSSAFRLQAAISLLILIAAFDKWSLKNGTDCN